MSPTESLDGLLRQLMQVSVTLNGHGFRHLAPVVDEATTTLIALRNRIERLEAEREEAIARADALERECVPISNDGGKSVFIDGCGAVTLDYNDARLKRAETAEATLRQALKERDEARASANHQRRQKSASNLSRNRAVEGLAYWQDRALKAEDGLRPFAEANEWMGWNELHEIHWIDENDAWEYLVVSDDRTLNKYDKDGWEPVSASPNGARFYFKRRLPTVRCWTDNP